MTEALRLVISYGWLGIIVWNARGEKESYIAGVVGDWSQSPERPSWHPFPTAEEAINDLIRRLREERNPT